MKSILYLYNKSPYTWKGFETVLKMLKSHVNRGVKTGLVLLQDAVIGVTGVIGERLSEVSDSVKIYVLLEDIKARGLAELTKMTSFNYITYQQLVNIIVNEYEHIVNCL